MLKYIDDVEMRRCVHRALNRGEAFHQLYPRYFKLRDFMRLKFIVLKTFESE